MRLLLDTHVVLWGYSEPERISQSAKRAIESEENESFVSLASLWEIATKARKGQLSPPDDFLSLIAADPQLTLLP